MQKDEFGIYYIYLQDVSRFGDKFEEIFLDDYDIVDFLDCVYQQECFTLIGTDYGI